MEINQQKFYKIYNECISRAKVNVGRQHYNDAIIDIRATATCAYNANVFYSDINLENIIRDVTHSCFTDVNINNPDQNRFVLIDSDGMDNKGLIQQYLRAIMANDKELLFITFSNRLHLLKQTFDELKNYGEKAKIVAVNKNSFEILDQIRLAIEEIKKFCPSKVFLHLMPWDARPLIVIEALKGVLKYNINLTDHAFWVGSSFIDYNIEMRSYGYNVSIEKRGILPQKELILPFFPITYSNQVLIDDLPTVPNDSVIILTGGAPYKMIGEDYYFFYALMDQILDISQNVYIYIAGFPLKSKEFDDIKSKMRNKDRLINIGQRGDISAVYRRCDIYLGTYPIMGGLMSQYAALNGLPIIALRRENDYLSDVASFVNHFSNPHFTYTNIKDLLKYAERLIEDKSYRINEGEKLKSAIMMPNRFYACFNRMVTVNQSEFPVSKLKIDYDFVEKLYMEIESKDHQIHKTLVRLYGFRSFLYFPLEFKMLFKSYVDLIWIRLFH